MRHHLELVIVHFFGWLLIVIGAAMFFVPFVPGIVFGIIGLYLISLKSVWFRKKLDQFIDKRPQLKYYLEVFAQKIYQLKFRIKNLFRR